MKILITGGAGFIGSSVIRYLYSSTKHKIINVDKLTYAGNLDSISNVEGSNRYSFEQIDICNKNALKKVFLKHQPDWIMHLAAESHVDKSINGAEIFIKTNIYGTFNLLEVSREYWSTLSSKRKLSFRFHHISTDEVFGDLEITDDLFTEDSSYSPSSPYSASKASSDHLVRAWHRTYGVPVLISNCSNNYGPFHFPEKLIPQTIINALSGKPIPIYGTGEQIRDWLYVDDHAKALYKVISQGAIGESYNIGGLNEIKNIDVVNSICLILDELASHKRPSELHSFSDLVTYVDDRPGHDFRYAIDASKITKDLKWNPEESFSSGIKKTVCWYLDNSRWWEKILKRNSK